MKANYCSYCGVAYTVGINYCDSSWCPSLTKQSIVTPTLKKKYIAKEKPHGWTRWYSIVSRSKKKQLECDLTLEDVRLIMSMSCVYCNSTDRIEIDRKDSEQGYIKSNVAPACHRCNTIKNNVVGYDEMMFIAGYLGWRS